ncbi:MAG: dTDP-4-dehydrorhamnose 3,5-epimerase [Parvularcula sp.]
MDIVQKTALPEVKLLTPRRFGDDRGFFSETFRDDWPLLEGGSAFVQDNHAFSATPNTIRGLHFQTGESCQAKLLRVVSGRILDVAVDIRRGSPTFGKVVAAELTAETGEQLFVPHGFAHGYQTLTPDCHVLYKVDRFYDPGREGALRWDDPDIAIPWRSLAADVSVSEKDKDALPLSGFESPFAYDPTAPYRCAHAGV